jgi:RNA polymerase sigma-70 factor, ECF subfamily
VTEESPHAADVRLLERIVSRDTAAVAELYDHHSSLLFGVIMRILRNTGDAEEVLQEVFVRVWTRADTYDGRLGSPAAWLTRMARNRAIDRLRAKRSRGDIDAPELETAAEGSAAVTTTVTPEDLARDQQRSDNLRCALDALAPDQRILIEAAFFEGYTHGELATRFRLPLGTVKTRIRNGMLAMRERLEQVI